MEKTRKGYAPISEVAGNEYTVGKRHRTTIVFSALPDGHKVPDAEINVKRLARRMRIGAIDRASITFASAHEKPHRVFPEQHVHKDDIGMVDLLTPAARWEKAEMTIPVNTPEEMDKALRQQVTGAGNDALFPSLQLEKQYDSMGNFLLFSSANALATTALFNENPKTGGTGWDDPWTIASLYLGMNAVLNAGQWLTHRFGDQSSQKTNGVRFSLVAGYQLDRALLLNALHLQPLIREQKVKN